MDSNSLEYKIIDECKCGYEELFNLIGLIEYRDINEQERFVETIVNLHLSGYLECKFHAQPQPQVTIIQLKDHIKLRFDKGEDLESYPKSGKEFSFFATDKAISLLKDKDKPDIRR